MTSLVRLMLAVRRAARAALPLTFSLGLGTLQVAGAAHLVPEPYPLAALFALLVLFAFQARKRAKAIDAGIQLDVEVGLPLVFSAYALALLIDGKVGGMLAPLIYLCVALIAAFAQPIASVLVVLLSVAFELSLAFYSKRGIWGLDIGLLYRLGFMSAFVLLNATILRAEIERVRKASRSRLNAEMERLRDDARSFRLLAAPASGSAKPVPSQRHEDEERLARSSVQEIHQSILFSLQLLRESLGLHTAMLLWENDAGTHLKISELSSEALNLCEGPFLTKDGIFGAVLSQRTQVSISHLKASYKLPYYSGPCPVRAVCAWPVFEHGAIRGVLVVDRIEDKAFSLEEQNLIEEAGRHAVRVIQNERVFSQLERAKVEQGKLYRAAESLGAATTEAQVVDAGIRSAREITSVDFAAVTLFDEHQKVHEIRAVSGEGAGELSGIRFRHNAGLVAMVLENRHPLPYRGEYDEKRQVVFTKKATPPPMPSMVVLPLVVHDRPLGTLVLGSKKRGAFHDGVRSTLEVLASHMAVSLSNARMLRRLEELATMDGLTGLLNKRAMLEVAEQKLTAAKRFRRKVSVLVTDIDHFKKVNDTYGHDVGDIIIKGLGDILRRMKRTTDAVARFGGEEFVVICEETDARGAMLLAERVREELSKTTFHIPGKLSEHGTPLGVNVTCSVGVATFPETGAGWDELFKAADEALYVSKRSGRNRSTMWHGAMRSGTSATPYSSKGQPVTLRVAG